MCVCAWGVCVCVWGGDQVADLMNFYSVLVQYRGTIHPVEALGRKMI